MLNVQTAGAFFTGMKVQHEEPSTFNIQPLTLNHARSFTHYIPVYARSGLYPGHCLCCYLLFFTYITCGTYSHKTDQPCDHYSKIANAFWRLRSWPGSSYRFIDYYFIKK